MRKTCVDFTFRSTFKSPLRRFLGKKTDKKNLKESLDAIEEGENISLVTCALIRETSEPQQVSECELPQWARRNVNGCLLH